MSHFEELRKHKELINLRESSRYSWREELSEGNTDHPYVDVMPNEKTGEDKPKKKEKKDVKEGIRLEPNTSMFTEEESDRLKDKHLERGGHSARADYSRPPATGNTFGKKKPSGKSALDMVKSQITKKYGEGALIDKKNK